MKTTAFDLQINPSQPGLSFHKLEKVRDPNFWSVRVSSDIRIIVHRSRQSLVLCYVDHHDDAYQWAERRKLETHPKTGAAQLVEVREKVQEITVPTYVATEQSVSPKLPLFTNIAESDLLDYGVPPEWLDDVKGGMVVKLHGGSDCETQVGWMPLPCATKTPGHADLTLAGRFFVSLSRRTCATS